jgi:hypothetical protein
MTDPLSPSAGVAPRLFLAAALSVVVWIGVLWAINS